MAVIRKLVVKETSFCLWHRPTPCWKAPWPWRTKVMLTSKHTKTSDEVYVGCRGYEICIFMEIDLKWNSKKRHRSQIEDVERCKQTWHCKNFPLSERWKLGLFCFLEHYIFLKKWEIFRTKFHVFVWDSGPPPTATPILGQSPKKKVKITEWLFSLKSFGLWTPTYP